MSRTSSVPSLAARLRTTLLASGLLLALVVGAAVTLLLQVRAEQDRVVGDYFTAVRVSNDLFIQVLEIGDTISSYLLSGEEAELLRLQALQQPRPNAPTADDLELLLEPAPEALAALQQARLTARAWLTDGTALVEQVQAGGPDAVSAADRAEERAAFDAVRNDYDGYLDELIRARVLAAEDLRRGTDLLFLAVLTAAATAALVFVLVGVAVRRWVTAPLADLARETELVRVGDLEHKVRGHGSQEVVALGEDVDAMRRAVVEQLAEVREGRHEVELARAMLEQQAEDLRRSNRDLEQFAYVASHDLQEPLRKVSSFCQMLQRRYSGQLDDRADQYIEFAVDGAKRMQLLINDLLAFSRVGRLASDFTDVPLDEALTESLRNLSAAVEETDAEVTADPLPVVRGERGLLVQLLQNLIGNAVKFRGDAPPRVHIGVRQVDGCWELSCSDNGIGIEPQYADRIFVIFQRLHPKADYEGTGIGLSLCKKIVEYHGGTIWLAEQDGGGTTFRWTLPVTSEPADDLNDDGELVAVAAEGGARGAAREGR